MWTTNDIPDLTGKVVIVTGANSGLGHETTRALAAKGARVIMACRNMEKGAAAARQIRSQSPEAALEVLALDLANLASVRAFAEAFIRRYSALDILCNNAGVMALPKKHVTADGFEMQFGTNHLGHFALTGRLLDMILGTPDARVVTVTSFVHRFGKIEFDNLNAERSYSQWRAYGLSKLANLLFTYELGRRFEASDQAAIAVAAHPGYAATNLQSHSRVFRLLNIFLAQKQEMGALPTLYAATMPDVQGGDFHGPDGFLGMRGHPQKVRSSKASHDAALAKRLWEVSEELTGVQYTGLL